ncbi:Yip1 family protein [Alkalihalobacillus trypoxylicola]|uniref:Yip1 domain-containing protein n=1 Tax=Alkalihalobacillus trypoxylicola TaxID=519424 RepID=A0A162FCG1_9BACI|nr:Yip1 family protein [Alkalihalobacillus trypoxylicola]KYG35282.1 hypothetical protein AZF04_02795 [Alkalihalobacillus trypoxylicola]
MNVYFDSLRYSLYLIFRPFDGFWDLHNEKRGSLGAAITITVGLIITYILSRQYTAFLFNPNNIKELNILLEVVNVALPFLLWCIANWCLTTLADGEGTFKEIIIASAYALTPLIMINLPLIMISHFINLEEGAFYYFFSIISVLWAGILLLIGTMVTHQYSMKKTLFIIVAILIGMTIMIFIALLITSVIQQIFGFFYVIFLEIVFRI